MDNFVAKRNTARFSQGVRLASGKFAMLKHGKSQPILCLARGFVNRYAGVGCSARNHRRLVTEGVPNASCVDVWFAMDMAADKPVVGDKKRNFAPLGDDPVKTENAHQEQISVWPGRRSNGDQSEVGMNWTSSTLCLLVADRRDPSACEWRRFGGVAKEG